MRGHHRTHRPAGGDDHHDTLAPRSADGLRRVEIAWSGRRPGSENGAAVREMWGGAGARRTGEHAPAAIATARRFREMRTRVGEREASATIVGCGHCVALRKNRCLGGEREKWPGGSKPQESTSATRCSTCGRWVAADPRRGAGHPLSQRSPAEEAPKALKTRRPGDRRSSAARAPPVANWEIQSLQVSTIVLAAVRKRHTQTCKAPARTSFVPSPFRSKTIGCGRDWSLPSPSGSLKSSKCHAALNTTGPECCTVAKVGRGNVASRHFESICLQQRVASNRMRAAFDKKNASSHAPATRKGLPELREGGRLRPASA